MLSQQFKGFLKGRPSDWFGLKDVLHIRKETVHQTKDELYCFCGPSVLPVIDNRPPLIDDRPPPAGKHNVTRRRVEFAHKRVMSEPKCASQARQIALVIAC